MRWLRRRGRARRGSVLITALIFASIIAISLASYIRLALNSLKLADRSFYQNAALNLAEVGLERALSCYNRLDDVFTPADAWASPWSIQSGNSVRATFSNIALGPGVTGEVKVFYRHYAKNLVSGSAPIAVPSTLPRTGDVAYNGVYNYEFASTWTLSASGSSSNVLTVNGPVVFLATAHSGRNVIDLAGNASIAVGAGGRLKVYTDGNVEASGNGLVNSNAAPETLQIFGANPTIGGQTIRFVGNGTSKAAVYAPNATFQLRGNGSLHGAVVANRINLNGNAAFHYDEALGNMTSGNPFGIVKWRELRSPAERATGAALFP